MNYPDLSGSKIISFDIETYDPELQKKGPGIYRKDGMIVGVSVANDKGFAEYYDWGHPGCSSELSERNKTYIKQVMGLQVPKLGANILYDLDWLVNGYDMFVGGKWHDIQVAEPLIDENRRFYNLDSLAKQYLSRGKLKEAIVDYCTKMGWGGNAATHIWEMPYDIVRPYALEDAVEPIEIFKQQWPIMYEQGLLDVYKMEMSLFPLLLQMRKVGVRIDDQKVQKGIDQLTEDMKRLKGELVSEHGPFNHNSSAQIAPILDKMGVPYGYTEKGNPNLDKDALEEMDIPFTKTLLELRSADKTRGTFLINSFTHMNVAGRIHSQFNPLRSDDYGTVSGRFSSTNPNLQQITNKDNPYGHGDLCRACFIPEEGYWWGKVDYSQIEYRFIAHFATGLKSDEVRKRYNEDPSTDYHALIMEWTGVNRSDAKRLNFGAAYAMGKATCAKKFHWTLQEAEELLERYHDEVPFIKATRRHVTRVAKGRGYIKTIMGRRARVTDLMRATHKEYSLFNRLIQGSAADLLKKAMLDAFNSGLYSVLTPHLTVHDELCQSVPQTTEGVEAFKELVHVMESAIKLKVPVMVDPELGPTWGDVESFDWGQII